ncbi:WD40-repeat-containing domain protein [Phascolomyces articulosus]|uniref:WD40-repeat-containing domain protein n=1 Tax=Phascolomyces articulosus TaxID=60185 RepID=A0AAD5PB14_9FUNG|nr:WD40-repeat-containing domain protein [Phascolomyces articulosus]
MGDNPAQLSSTLDKSRLDYIVQVKTTFQQLTPQQKTAFLSELLNCCDNQLLAFVHTLIAPRLKIDFLKQLPIELALHVLSFIDDPQTLTRASRVSHFWNDLLKDESTWKLLCLKYQYKNYQQHPTTYPMHNHHLTNNRQQPIRNESSSIPYSEDCYDNDKQQRKEVEMNSNNDLTVSSSSSTSTLSSTTSLQQQQQHLHHFSYREFFKRKYNIGTAWNKGGDVRVVDDVFGGELITSLQFDEKYIVVGCDNHRIVVFDAQTAQKIRTLEGHEGGVWALEFKGGEKHDPERLLVSGGCDRDVRVWDLDNGRLLHVLRGHTSTVRCLRMKDKQIAVTGSRDATMRVWDIQRGVLLHVLLGHQASVRCLDICDNVVASGSYDYSARLWDIRTGRCLHVLTGHHSQIYAIAFDGQKVVTGSLDSNIRVFSASTGQCLATLFGHTSLVGHLQLRGDILVSGGSDGCLRVWDLERYECVQQISAHDNSVTSLQFDDRKMVSGSADGSVKLWDIREGRLIRNISQPTRTVWKIQFSDTKAVILMQRKQGENPGLNKTILELHNFDLEQQQSS